MLTRALGPRRRLGDSSACLSPPPDRDTTELRGPHEPATTHRSDRIHWMDRTDRGSADRLGMPNTCPAPAAGGARHSCRPSRDGAPNALGTPEFHRSGEPGASRLRSRRRCRGRRAGPLDTGTLNHSSRAYTWGAAIAALHGITFDRELLYLAAMFHDTGIPSPVPDVDFTVRSAALAREFTDSHHVPADIRELVANAIAMHYTPGVGLQSGAEAYLLSAGASVDVFGLRSNEIPDAVRRSVIQEYPRLGFKREFAGLLRAEAKQVPRGRAWYLHRFAMSDLSIRLAPFRG